MRAQPSLPVFWHRDINLHSFISKLYHFSAELCNFPRLSLGSSYLPNVTKCTIIFLTILDSINRISFRTFSTGFKHGTLKNHHLVDSSLRIYFVDTPIILFFFVIFFFLFLICVDTIGCRLFHTDMAEFSEFGGNHDLHENRKKQTD